MRTSCYKVKGCQLCRNETVSPNLRNTSALIHQQVGSPTLIPLFLPPSLSLLTFANLYFIALALHILLLSGALSVFNILYTTSFSEIVSIVTFSLLLLKICCCDFPSE